MVIFCDGLNFRESILALFFGRDKWLVWAY
jgi:hypothetical protein